MLPFIPNLADSLSLHDRFTSRSMMLNMEPLSYGDLTIRNPEIIEIMELMYSVSHFIDGFDYNDLSSSVSERVQVSDSIYLTEWKLCQLEDVLRSKYFSARASSSPPSLYSEDTLSPQEPRGPATDLSDALVYAAHLFLHLAVRGQPPMAYRHKILTEALVSSLYGPLMSLNLLGWPGAPVSESPVHVVDSHHAENPHSALSSPGDQAPSPLTEMEFLTRYASSRDQSRLNDLSPQRDELHDDILLWILFTGCCVRTPTVPYNSTYMYYGCIEGNPREFFVNAMVNYCRNRQLWEMSDVSKKLKSVVWLGCWCDYQFETLWREIEPRIGGWASPRSCFG